MTYFFKNKNVCIIIQFWFSFCGLQFNGKNLNHPNKLRYIVLWMQVLHSGEFCWSRISISDGHIEVCLCATIPELSIFFLLQLDSFFLSRVHVVPLLCPAATRTDKRREFNTTRGSQQLFHRGNTSRQRLHLSLQGPRYSTKPHGFLSLNKNISSEEFFT